MCSLYQTKDSRNPIQIFGAHSLHRFLFFGILICKFQPHQHSPNLDSVFSTWWRCYSLFGLWFSVPWLGLCTQQKCGNHPTCFLFLSSHIFLLPITQCLKTVSLYNFSSYMVVYSKRLSLEPKLSFWKQSTLPAILHPPPKLILHIVFSVIFLKYNSDHVILVLTK